MLKSKVRLSRLCYRSRMSSKLITAYFAPGISWNEDPGCFEIDGLNIISNLPHIITVQCEVASTQEKEIVKFLSKLERLCLSYFICDLPPRMVDGFTFEFSVDDAEKAGQELALPLLLGNSIDIKKYFEPRVNDLADLMGRNGWLYNSTTEGNPSLKLTNDRIKEWYNFFTENSYITQQVSLVMRGFGNIFLSAWKVGVNDTHTLASAILELVPGLRVYLPRVLAIQRTLVSSSLRWARCFILNMHNQTFLSD